MSSILYSYPLSQRRVTTVPKGDSGWNVVNAAETLCSYTKSGVANPRWKSLVKVHADATTDFDATRQSVQLLGIGSAVVNYHTTVLGPKEPAFEYYSGYFPLSNSAFGAVDPTLHNKAFALLQSKVYKKLNQLQTTFSSGTFAGELRETLHGIRNPAKGLRDLITGQQFRKYQAVCSALGKRSRSSAARNRAAQAVQRSVSRRSVSKALADLWLETSFGWKPLISDIDGAMRVLAERVVDRGSFEPFVVYASASSCTTPSIGSGGLSRLSWTTERYVVSNVSFRAYGEHHANYGGPTGRLGLSWGDFVPTVWELLPYSFLVDYFSNIGDVLSAAFVDLSGLNRLSYTEKVETFAVNSFSNFRKADFPFGDEDSASGGCSPIVLVSKTLSRRLGLPLSVPGVRFEFPIRSNQWANMGALIASQFKRGTSFPNLL